MTAATDTQTETERPTRRRLPGRNAVLYAVALLLACGCVFGGVLVVQAHRGQDRDAVEQERYGDVLAAADAEVTALVNIDYRTAQDSFDKVAAGATGKFADQYKSGTASLAKPLTQAKSVMDGKVQWSGVVDIDSDSASVIAATTGTVANNATKGKPVERAFRVKLDLVLEDGQWKTSNVEWVS